MQYQSSCATKLARKCEIEHWLSCGADGRAGGLRAVYGHVITKFSRMGIFTYPWCSAGALRAPELRYNNIVRNLTAIGSKLLFLKMVEDLFSFNSVRTHINSSSTSPGHFFTTNLQFGLSGEILISFVFLMCNAFIIWILVSFPAVAVYRQRRGQFTKLRNCPILPYAALKGTPCIPLKVCSLL